MTAAAAADWGQAYGQLHVVAAELGDPEQRFAVRSSATAEDLAGASFAGQYETVLDVRLEELPQAVQQVVDSAASARVAAYRQAHPQPAPANRSGSGGGMAVLVQVMVPADAAGVAFTANPLTGDRDEVVISAVRGLGERLVGGQATGDQWIVRDGQARRIRATEQAISADQAGQIATLARRVQPTWADPSIWMGHTATPAHATGSRGCGSAFPPDDALPDPLDVPHRPLGLDAQPAPGLVVTGPITPSLPSVLLNDRPRRAAATRAHVGTTLPFPLRRSTRYSCHRQPVAPRHRDQLLQGVADVRFMRDAFLAPARTVAADRRLLAGLAEQWRTELLPRYQRLVQEGDQQVQTASPEQLVAIVDQVAAAAGEQLWSLAVVGGAAWKMEGALARFYRQHLAAIVDASVQELLVTWLPGSNPPARLRGPEPRLGHPTAGAGSVATSRGIRDRHRR